MGFRCSFCGPFNPSKGCRCGLPCLAAECTADAIADSNYCYKHRPLLGSTNVGQLPCPARGGSGEMPREREVQ
jgi:hypothetical protein